MMRTSDKFAPVDRPAPAGWRRGLALFLATGAGLGCSPVASGTVGSVWGLLLVWAMQPLPLWGQTILAIALCLLAVPICHAAESALGRKDDGRIVADEYMTFPVCMLGLPCTPLMLAAAFLSCRFFDIVKPPPADRLQRIPGGIGIVIDDVVAALYSLAVNQALYWLAIRQIG
jgi:phosphatidylglycerophosphatase A